MPRTVFALAILLASLTTHVVAREQYCTVAFSSATVPGNEYDTGLLSPDPTFTSSLCWYPVPSSRFPCFLPHPEPIGNVTFCPWRYGGYMCTVSPAWTSGF